MWTFLLTAQGLPQDLPACWKATSELVLRINDAYYTQVSSTQFSKDEPDMPTDLRLKNPELQAHLSGQAEIPMNHYASASQLGQVAYMKSDYLLAGIFHSWGYRLAHGSEDHVKAQEQAYAAAVAFYLTAENAGNSQLRRKAADFFVAAGYYWTAGLIYENLDDENAAARARSFSRDRFDIASSRPTSAIIQQVPQHGADQELQGALNLFGLPQTATVRQFKERFGVLARQFHPDTRADSTDTKEIIELFEAREILKKNGLI